MTIKPNAIIGASGFVGGTLARHCQDACRFNSKNICNIRLGAFDVVYCAGAPAVKWLANKNPEADAQTLDVLKGHLETITCNWFVLISTIDVESSTSGAYGLHRKKLEEWVQEHFSGRCTVFRLPALFGMGLKKNALFDLLTNNQTEAIKVNHIFQWYDLRDLWEDIGSALSTGAQFVQAYSEPVLFSDIVKHVFPERWKELQYQTTDLPVVYDFAGTVALRTPALRIIARMSEFRNVYELCATSHDICISNLAWNPEHESHILGMLRLYGFRAIEIAPTRYGTWEDLFSGAVADAALANIEDNGFVVHSLQAVFYATSLNVFADSDGFVAHFKKVCGLARRFHARVIVFGSPANRLRPTELSLEEAVDLFVQAMRSVAETAAASDVIICVEPNATDYKCNFLTTLQEVQLVVEKIDHPNIKINYDTGNAAMEKDVLTTQQALLVHHVQVSEPFLGPVRSWPTVSQVMMTNTSFKSIEMKPVPYAELPEIIFGLLYSYTKMLAQR